MEKHFLYCGLQTRLFQTRGTCNMSQAKQTLLLSRLATTESAVLSTFCPCTGGAELELPDASIATTLKGHLGPLKVRNILWATCTLLDVWLIEYQGVLVEADIRASYRLNLPHVAAGGSVGSASMCALLQSWMHPCCLLS